MYMIVVGCGRLGSGLAYRLYLQGHQVVVIDEADTAFNNLPADFHGRTVPGDALNQGVLERAGVKEARGLAAVTSDDAANAVIAHIARKHYKVPHVVSRNFNPALIPVHESFNLQTVSSAVWGAQRIEEMLYHGEVHTIFSAGNGEVEIYEITITEPWDGHTLGELIPSGECVPVALTRAGRAFIPDGNTVLQTDDLVQVSATLEGAKTIRQRLLEQKEG
jgi:trk system potassium uptake protein